jgi:hypothetical protein
MRCGAEGIGVSPGEEKGKMLQEKPGTFDVIPTIFAQAAYGEEERSG